MNASRLLLLAAVLPAASVLGQAPGLGPIFSLNSYTTQNQLQPAIADGPDGSFVVAWESFGQDGSGRGIFFRRFDALGAPLADDFPANAYTDVDQKDPDVAADSAGNFVIVWSGARNNDPQGVALRIFDNSGSPIFPIEREAHPATDDTEDLARVARNDDGFVIVWRTLVPVSGYELRAQLYEPDSDTIGPHFQVAGFTTATIADPSIAIDSTGHFVIAWSSYDDGDATGIRARAFDEDGLPIGGVLEVNTATTGFQQQPSVAMDGQGGFVVAWASGETQGYPILARRYDATATPLGPPQVIGNGVGPVLARRDLGGYGAIWVPASGNTVEFGLIEGARFDDAMAPIGPPFPLHDADESINPFARTLAANIGRHFLFAWQDTGPAGNLDIFARRGGFPDGAAFAVDARPPTGGTSNQNGVLEAGERVLVDQAYRNHSGAPYELSGVASNGTAPAGLTLTIHDDFAQYGTLAGAAGAPESPSGSPTSDCVAAGDDCFEFELTGTRVPGLHWDTTYDEALSEEVSVTRTLHVGGSFADVAPDTLFYPFVENLFHNGITAGGACGGYCPADGVKRQQMAVFLLKSKFGPDYVPPQPTGTVFLDVPLSNPFAGFIEDLYARGVTGGCILSPLQFCPDAIVNRQQMAVFLLKAAEGSAYDPPDCTGVFTDVPCTPGVGFPDFIEELYERQITGGCAAVPLQYCPTNTVTRGQMSAFLVKNFGLPLYGP